MVVVVVHVLITVMITVCACSQYYVTDEIVFVFCSVAVVVGLLPRLIR